MVVKIKFLIQGSLLSVLSLMAASPLFAYSSLPESKFPLPVILSFSGGVGIFSNSAQSRVDFYPANGTYLNYSPTEASEKVGSFGVFAGVELPFEIQNKWVVQTGLAYNIISAYSENGTNAVGENLNNPVSTTTYDYSYRVSSQQIFSETKLIGTVFQNTLHPYVLLDLGVAINKAYSYSVNTSQSDPNSTASYQDNTQTNFAYGMGLGVDWELSNSWRIGLGYRLLNLGPAELGEGSWDPDDGGPVVATSVLKTNPLYINEIAAHLIYTF